jgi:hypothetical protein
MIEVVDPMTKTPMQSFCIGQNAIDVKLTNNSNYRKYVSVLNRDTKGMERTLYRGWLEPGTQYLSTLIGMRLELTGPAGTEMLRADVYEYGQALPGNWVSFYVQDCGGSGSGQWPPGQWPGQYAQMWAQVSPYAIEQGKKGVITLQTSVGSYQAATYSFEILNSWNQLWKRIPVNKAPYQRYQITLPVGTSTKPGLLTYTVNLWAEAGMGERRKIATTRFSFRVVTPGSAQTQYESGYPGYPGYSGYPAYPTYPGYSDPGYSTYMPPYYGSSSYYEGSYSNEPFFLYGGDSLQGSANERQIQ